jgi:hypothetical protein
MDVASGNENHFRVAYFDDNLDFEFHFMSPRIAQNSSRSTQHNDFKPHDKNRIPSQIEITATTARATHPAQKPSAKKWQRDF